MFGPSDEELTKAHREGRRISDYTWGTFSIVNSSGAYTSFSWKLWLGVMGVVFGGIFLSSLFTKH